MALGASGAAVAQRTRLADPPAVKNQRVRRVGPQRRWQGCAELFFRDLRMFRPRDAQAVGDSKDVAVDRQPRYTQRVAEHNVCRFAANTGKPNEVVHPWGDLACLAFEERLGDADEGA